MILRKLKPLTFSIFFISFLSSSYSLADVTIKVNHNATAAKGAGVSPLYIKDDKIMIKDAGVEQTSMVFDSKRQVMTVINHQNKSYLEFNEEVMQQISMFLDNMQKQFMAQFENLPPAQRQQMQQMAGPAFEAMMGNSEPQPTPEFKKTGATKTINGFKCKVADVAVNGAKSGEICLAQFKDLKFSEADYATMKSFSDFFARLAAAFPKSKEMVKDIDFWQLSDNEVPVSYSKLVAGKAVPSVQLESISTEKLSADMFQVPEGYKAEKLNEQLTQMPSIRVR